MNREKEVMENQKRLARQKYLPDSSLLYVELAEISVTLAKICDSLGNLDEIGESLGRIAENLESAEDLLSKFEGEEE